MGNLFRCNSYKEKRKYIIKAVGQLQEGKTVQALHVKSSNGGENNYGTYWSEAKYGGWTSAEIDFDATNWNKIHIKQAYFENYGSSDNIVGVTMNFAVPEVSKIFEHGVYVNVTKRGDYVIDISSMTGTVYFFIYAGVPEGGITAKTIVEGDVYLTK